MRKHMLKKFTVAILVFSMVFGINIVCPSGLRNICMNNVVYGETNDSYYKYSVKYDGSIYIEGYTGIEAKVIIPDEINGKKVTAIGTYAFAECKTVEEVVVLDTVTEICAYSFADCSNLKSVQLSENAEYIGAGAFRYCSSLKSIRVPDGVTEIYDYTFANCSNLKKVELSKNLKNIGDYSFGNCSSLKYIEIPKSVEYISEK